MCLCVCVCWGKWSRYAWKRWWLIQKAVAELRMLNNINLVGLVANDGCRLNLFMFFWACVLPPISFLSSLTLPSPLFSPLLSTFLLSYPLPFSTLLYLTLPYTTGEGKGEEWYSRIPSSPLLSSLLVFFFTSQPSYSYLSLSLCLFALYFVFHSTCQGLFG